MKILIDNGHGVFTPGKRSPDGQFREAFYTRQIAKMIVSDLNDRGYDASLLVPEDDDIPLKERCNRVNCQCLIHGTKNVICVSIHVNAAGDSTSWTNATGWSVFTHQKGRQEQTFLLIVLPMPPKSISRGSRSVATGLMVTLTSRLASTF